ncbi:MAG: hypothetical protein AABY13_01540, partial [Nanoarchaeota archaeon]
MFKFLKDKLKSAISSFSSKVEEEPKPVEDVKEAAPHETPKVEKKGIFQRIKESVVGPSEEPAPVVEQEP